MNESNQMNQTNHGRMLRPLGVAKTIVIGSNPCASAFQGFMSWKDRSHAVTGAEGSCQEAEDPA